MKAEGAQVQHSDTHPSRHFESTVDGYWDSWRIWENELALLKSWLEPWQSLFQGGPTKGVITQAVQKDDGR